MGFVVVTDSTADIAPDIAAEHGIEVVPLNVTIAGETLLDGTLSQDEFFSRMKTSKQLPTTSQPSVGEFVAVYERMLKTADEVLSVHISEKLSGTFDSARQAAQEFAGLVHVFDSRNLSAALAFQVFEAAAAAAEGISIEETFARLERVRDRVRMIVGLDSLENLAKGGRIGNVSAFLGSMLDLKVTLTVNAEGAFEPVARSRGEKAALRHTLDWIAGHTGESNRGRFAIGYAQKKERAEWLAAQLRDRLEVLDYRIYEAGSVIAAHTGTGWGVAVLPED